MADFDTATKLEELRLQIPDIANPDQVYAQYDRLFRDYGIDVEALSVEQAATRIARSRIRFELVVALNTWAWRLKLHPRPQELARWEHLRAISQASDPDPWRRCLTSAAHARDLKTLRAAAAEADLERLHPRNLAHLGSTLTFSGDPDAGVAVLRKAQRQHPGDFLINEDLAECLAQLTPPAWDEVVEFRRVVVALRPGARRHTGRSAMPCSKKAGWPRQSRRTARPVNCRPPVPISTRGSGGASNPRASSPRWKPPFGRSFA